MGASDTPVMLPCYFFLRTKIIYPFKCIVFSKNKNNMGGHQGHHTLPTLNPPPTTSLTSTPHTPQPPTHPWRKSGALMPDISWAPPHSLLIQ